MTVFQQRAARVTLGLALFFLFLQVPALAGVVELLDDGDEAVKKAEYALAAEAYQKALDLEPDNFRVLRSLAETLVQLKRFNEAEKLIDRVLAMEITNGARVAVTLKGENVPREAELVDETVLPAESGKNNMRNYLSPVTSKPVPHYRLFFFKTSEMKLIPKTDATIRYLGVPRRVHELMRELQGTVKNQVIAASEPSAAVVMVSLQGGCFAMGSDRGSPDEQPVHDVCLSPFKIDKHEVPQQEFLLKMGANPSRFKGADLPVESVTWNEARIYCERAGKRLPTEAEWEYAARAGKTTAYPWGDELDPKQVNYCDKNCKYNLRDLEGDDGFANTAPVGSFPPNAFGLFDMAGNVSEWTADWMQDNYYRISPKKNPAGPGRRDNALTGGTNEKVIRGGAWNTDAFELRSSNRKSLWTDYRIDSLGFRCAADS
jgi:formylglycine-generating enzyme required for sulfatase activity